jgi:hypothetical protein
MAFAQNHLRILADNAASVIPAGAAQIRRRVRVILNSPDFAYTRQFV